MILVGLLSWWYGRGWLDQYGLVKQRLLRVSDYFSLALLIKTLFAPFRQISAGQVRGSLGDKFRAFVDKLFSRLIGAAVRSIVFCLGAFVIAAQALLGGLLLLVWPLVPLLPLIGVIMALIGWTPQWM